jgi:hypothetical protein
MAFEDGLTRITHHVHAVGEVKGATPNRLQWALAPTRDYELLDLLSRALKEGVLVDSYLKRAAEANCLRYDRAGKRLADPIPAQLLALALAEPGWRGLREPTACRHSLIGGTQCLIILRSPAFESLLTARTRRGSR